MSFVGVRTVEKKLMEKMYDGKTKQIENSHTKFSFILLFKRAKKYKKLLIEVADVVKS